MYVLHVLVRLGSLLTKLYPAMGKDHQEMAQTFVPPEISLRPLAASEQLRMEAG